MTRVLTGDRPTGPLHIGHYVGSLVNRLALQNTHECLFMVADLHTLTTKPSKHDILTMRQHTIEVVLDWLACGIDPERSIIFLQSGIEEIPLIHLLLSMLVGINRLQNLPSIKEMAKNAHIEEASIPFGLLGYPILQSADILGVKGLLVPVGQDNVAHVELTRYIAKKFNQFYGEVFPIPEVYSSQAPSLIGTDGKGKMSKSAGNAIFLSDDPDQVRKKIRSLFTDPQRVHAHIPGSIENNPLFEYLSLFSKDLEQVETFKKRYQEGTISDLEIKEALTKDLLEFLAPIAERRKSFQHNKGFIEHIIVEGTEKAKAIYSTTYKEMIAAMGIGGSWKKLLRTAHEYRQHPLS